MKLFAPLTVTSLVSLVSSSSIRFPNLKAKADTDPASLLSAANHYGSPIPAWEAGYAPSWYNGDNPDLAPGTVWLKDPTVCTILNRTPNVLHCPSFPLTLAARALLRPRVPQDIRSTYDSPPVTITRTTPGIPPPTVTPPGPSQLPPPPPPPVSYQPSFAGLKGAIQADDFLTFGLVDTVADCQAMCNNVPECGFVNTYHDVNGKNGSPLLTCSLYATCHGADQATNTGGQSQPDGSINFITDSDGWCKK